MSPVISLYSSEFHGKWHFYLHIATADISPLLRFLLLLLRHLSLFHIYFACLACVLLILLAKYFFAELTASLCCMLHSLLPSPSIYTQLACCLVRSCTIINAKKSSFIKRYVCFIRCFCSLLRPRLEPPKKMQTFHESSCYMRLQITFKLLNANDNELLTEIPFNVVISFWKNKLLAKFIFKKVSADATQNSTCRLWLFRRPRMMRCNDASKRADLYWASTSCAVVKSGCNSWIMPEPTWELRYQTLMSFKVKFQNFNL